MRRLAALLLLAGLLPAEEPSVSAIVSTVRFHPGGEPAAVGLRMLSRKDAPGWQALSALVLELAEDEPAVSRKAATALAEGPEPERLKIVAATYLQSGDAATRAILAEGLAYDYAEHAPLLLKHMREDRPGADDLARILAPETLPEEELRKLLSVTRLARIVYDALLARGLTVKPEELGPWARAIATECLDPARCREWALREPDFTILLAVAAALPDKEEDVRDGAQCLLLTVSGRKLHADADVWRSWIAGNRDRYARPGPASPGEVFAAIVRGARFLRKDLSDDGCALLPYDHDRHHVIGSTALAVLALRAAECPVTDPAIAKAVETTLLAFDKAGAPALRPIEHRSRETYVLSLLAIALTELDPARYRIPIEALRQRILSGQQAVGAWGYYCFGPTDQGDPGRWDNSCTQYAVLALRALASKGFAVPPEAWQRIVGHLERGVSADGRWDYCHGDAGNGLSMTSAGIGSLAIALEGLHGRDAARAIRDHPALAKGRAHLGRLLMDGGLPAASTYAFYGVERACVLTAAKTFRSANRTFDWYVAGARQLLATQTADGSMHGAGDYGSALDTAYAILFLAKATRTVGGAEPGVVAVDLPPGKDVPETAPLPSPPPPPIPPRPPDLSVEWDPVPTRTGEAVIVGTVKPPNAALLVDGKPVKPDARGRFFAPLTITRDGPVAVVARGADGLEARRDVTVAFDMQAPRVRLTGPPQRHVGKQILVFRSDEPLRAVSVAGRVYPADGPVVRAAVEVGEGNRTFSWTATDRAGNEGRGEMDLEAENRFLSLDGKSALRIDLGGQPREFTVECWVRGDDPAQAGSIVSNAQASGFGLYWASKHYNYPHGLVRCGGVFAAAGARKPWKWGSWTHLAFTYDGKAARFFANGKLHATVETKEPHVLSRFPLWVGAEPDGNGNPVDPFRGSIDEVRVSRGARYAADFRPERNFLRDDKTVVLLHFDLDTLADGIVLDDSGACRHATFVGQPLIAADGRGPAPSGVLAHAKEELRGEMPAAVAVPVLPAEREAEEASAHAEAGKRLGPVAVTVRVQTPQGSPVPGVEVRALQEALDLTADPVTTDAQGDAVVHLPRGPWRIDLSSADPGAGRVVFARARFAVRDEGKEFVVLDATREVELRTAKGELRTPDSMTVAWPDFSFHRSVEAAAGRLEILTSGDAPILVQAVRRPDERGGYIFRRAVGPGRTKIETEPPDATTHVFKGAGVRRLDVRYTSADALPVDLAFAENETREIALAGMPEIVLHFGSEQAGTRFRFLPRPYALDGKRTEFQGAPEFDVSVGFQRNTRSQYGPERVNSISFRVLLTTASGLLLSPDAPYTISWQQMLDGKPRASGTTKPADPVWTPPLDPAAVPKLRYQLQVRGPGVNKKLDVEGSEQTVAVHEGRVRTWCFPAVEANARAWVRCINLALRAYEETCPYRIAHLDVERSMHMPLPVIGMGGYGGDNGWMWLPGDTVYGFHGTWWWTGLLSHELGHVYRYGHSNAFENKVMVQAGRRAGRRLESIRPGMERVPEGNRYRALLDAVEEEDEGVRGTAGDATGDGVLVPNLEITGDDSVFVWYYRSQFGEAAQASRRKYGAAWSWLLTLKGFTDEEIRIAMLSRAAGTSLAWLARMRGIDVRDRRIAEAFELLGAAGENLPWHDQRHAILSGWTGYPLPADLEGGEARMRAELGDRRARVQVLLRIAKEHILRGDAGRGEQATIAALVEARLGGDGMVEAALRDAAPLWAGR